MHTVGGTLWNWALASTTTNANAVDNITLLGLVTETASLIWARWAGSAVDNVQLAKLYYALSAMFNECIAETCCPQYIFECSILEAKLEILEVILYGSDSLTSQQRTRRRNRRTSDCFFF